MKTKNYTWNAKQTGVTGYMVVTFNKDRHTEKILFQPDYTRVMNPEPKKKTE